MPRKPLLLFGLLLLVVGGMWGAGPVAGSTPWASPLPPAQSFTSSTSVPLDFEVFIPCALGGAGESVHLSGSLHILWHFTATPAGGYLIKSLVQPQGVSGIGLTSGAKYQGTGVTQDSFHSSGLPYVYTYINNFKLIGPGPGNNYRIHENVHTTVNAQGVLTAFVDQVSVTCN